MSAADLYGEMRQALSHPHATPYVAVGRVRPDGNNYVPDDDGPILAGVVAVIPHDELIDLIAIDLHRPERWRRRTGLADLLGESNLCGLSFTGEPITVHRGPAEWLNAGGDGVAVLEWTASVVGLLSSIRGGLIVADVQHGTEVRRRLTEATKPELPPILTPDIARAA